MSKYWSEVVHDLTPYVPGEQPKVPGLVKLNTNECPYGPSLRVLHAIREAATEDLRLYPDPDARGLKEVIAAHHGLKADQVFVGNGSDEVLAHAFQALLKHARPLLFPDISYSFYPVYARLYGIRPQPVALDPLFRVCVEDYITLCARGDAGGIILPNPNAPTGMALGLDEITRLVAGCADVPVVIDEAYVDFGADTAATLISRHPNVLVVRTLSKSRALAGLRVGYALGSAELIEAMTRVKDSFNSYPLDRLAIAGATAAMQDETWFVHTCERIAASRGQLTAGLQALGFEVLPSAANFVFARHPSHSGAELASRLREQRILVRHFREPERIAPFLRITVGTDAQCDVLLQALAGIIQTIPALG